MGYDGEIGSPDNSGTPDDREKRIISAIEKNIQECVSQTSLIVQRWRDNYDMFSYGSQFDDKQDWQASFSINKIQSATRIAQSELVNLLLQPDGWFELEARGDNPKAEVLAPAIKKMMDYYLEQAKFKRHASTFFLTALISMGTAYVGWMDRLIQNPEYVLEQSRKAREKDAARQAPHVANPQVTDATLSPGEIEQKIAEAIDDLKSYATTGTVKKKKIPQYIRVGGLQILEPNHERVYWDPNVSYMEDSKWRAFTYDMNLWEVKQWGKLGFVSPSKVKNIRAMKLSEAAPMQNLRYKNVKQTPRTIQNKVEITCYFGPLIIDDEVKKDKYFAIIANRSTILKEGDYPFWEPPGHETPVISTSVKQVPWRATGAGIGDGAIELQRMYDANYQLLCDTYRYGIAGLNIVDYQSVIDKGSLHEGLEPGKIIEVRGDPQKVFHRVQLTSNIENQVSPIQEVIRQAIDDSVGINDLMGGSPNPHSRTSAAETNARVQGSQRTTNIIALDLEQNYLIPFLEKVFARVLQFGIDEIQSNPELQNMLTQEEQYELQQLGQDDRLEVLNRFYSLKIKGFSAENNRAEKLEKINEFLKIANSPGPLSSLLDFEKVMEKWSKYMELNDDEADLLIKKTAPVALVQSENTTLLSNHPVQVQPEDDDEMHLKVHMGVANVSQPTPALIQHIQMHQQQLMAKQAQQQAQQQTAVQSNMPQKPQPKPAPPPPPPAPPVVNNHVHVPPHKPVAHNVVRGPDGKISGLVPVAH